MGKCRDTVGGVARGKKRSYSLTLCTSIHIFIYHHYEYALSKPVLYRPLFILPSCLFLLSLSLKKWQQLALASATAMREEKLQQRRDEVARETNNRQEERKRREELLRQAEEREQVMTMYSNHKIIVYSADSFTYLLIYLTYVDENVTVLL